MSQDFDIMVFQLQVVSELVRLQNLSLEDMARRIVNASQRLEAEITDPEVLYVMFQELQWLNEKLELEQHEWEWLDTTQGKKWLKQWLPERTFGNSFPIAEYSGFCSFNLGSAHPCAVRRV